MKNGDMPAMAVTDECGMPFNELPKEKCTLGLTKREYFAGLAMQGFAADGEFSRNINQMAELAVEWSNALLKELEKEQDQ